MVKAELIEREKLTENLAVFRFQANVREFIPGQYNALRIETYRTEKSLKPRALSIASKPSDLPNLEYLVRWVKGGGKRSDGKGEMTTELFELSDDELRTSQFSMTDTPKGKLYLEGDDDRNVIMVATGTGLAPFISQLRTAIERKIDLSKYILIHGVANCDDLAYMDELSQYQKDRNLTYLHVESRSKCEADSEINYVGQLFFNRDSRRIGRIKISEIEEAIEEERTENPKIEQILNRKLSPDDFMIELCGNPDMINNMTRLMEAKGFIDGKDVLSEKYWAAKKETYST